MESFFQLPKKMKMKINSKIFYGILIIALPIATFFWGIKIAENKAYGPERILELQNKEALANLGTADFGAFWKAWNIINEKYVDNDKTDTQTKVWGAIKGLSESLGDPYTNFLPPQETALFEENIKGNFGGVGMEVDIRENTLIVVSPLKDTPAERAGIRAGDNILAIDDKNTAGLSINDAVSLIRGEIGTSVKLTIFRDGKEETFDINVKRETIKIPTIRTELRPDGIYVIRLFNFSAISPDEFRKALREFIQKGEDKMILDLRGNPGGFLQAAVDIASWFLPAGKVIVTEDYARKGEDVVHRSLGYNIFNDKLKLVILLDQGSASASEILAGALSEHGVATLVGAQTFGKGSVQELVDITDQTSLKVTVAKWLTPTGKSISEGGIIPDIEVEVTREELDAGHDSQLEKAAEILLQ